jgi:hypothetical protein
MFIKRINGSCDFSIEQKFETAEKAAEGRNAKSVEVKVSNHKIDFTTVRKEDDENHTEDPKVGGQSEKEV